MPIYEYRCSECGQDHEVLQKVLETEPERLLPQLTQSAPLIQAAIRADFAEYVEYFDLPTE